MGAAGHQQRPPTGGGRNQLVNTASRLRFRPASPGLSREAPGLSVTRGGRATKPTGAGWGSAPTCAGWTAAGQGSLPASWIPLSDRSASDANGLPKGSQTRRGTSFFTTRTRVGRTHHDPSPGVFVVGRRGFSASSSPGGSSKKSITGPCPSTTVVTGAGLMRRPGGVWTPLLGSRLPVPVVRGVSVGGPRWPSATAAPPALDGGGAATGWTTPTGG